MRSDLPIVVIPDISCEALDGQVPIDFLFPHGIYIPLNVHLDTPLEFIKKTLWKEAESYPLYKLLKRFDAYSFWCIREGQKEEILDESQCLSDVRPSSMFLRLVEKQGDEKKKTLVRQVNILIGRGVYGQHDQESIQTAEISHFRSHMEKFCEDIVQQRKRQGWLEKVAYKHPPRLRSTSELPHQTQKTLTNGHIVISVQVKQTSACYKIQVEVDDYPELVIQKVLNKVQKTSGQTVNSRDHYVLKVTGLEDYLYGSYPLVQFKYVYSSLLRNVAPEFWLLTKGDLLVSAPAVPPRRRSEVNTMCFNSVPRNPAPSRDREVSVWTLTDNFSVTVKSVSKIEMGDGSKVKMWVGLYHGPEALCEVHQLDEAVVTDGSCKWKTDVTFDDIPVGDLPHSGRLCFALYSIKRKDLNPLAWVNIPVFDFRSRLVSGEFELPMWPVADHLQLEDRCNPIGTVSSNPVGTNFTTLYVQFPTFNIRGPIRYPSMAQVLQCAAENMEKAGQPGAPDWHPSKTHLVHLRDAIDVDPLATLSEQDKGLIWLLKYECREQFPYALPKLLTSVKWDNHIDVAKMQALLQTWPVLLAEQALELLDFNFPDKYVRQFAVKCLEALTSDELSQYLLQLVQALKYESYLCCPLTEFLLTRALHNQHLGHQLFWLLKSEIHDPTVSVRYSLFLEVYLKSSREHLSMLMKQHDALRKMQTVNALVKCERYGNMRDQKVKELARGDMHSVLQQTTYQEVLSDLVSPLTPLYKLKELVVEKCKFMDSKKRPLWLVWKNDDSDGQDVYIIYKNGDDLRQDMLTLQILQVMDNLWKAEGLDLRMNPYGCIATGNMTGIIEVVTQAETIANIQKWYKNDAFDRRALYEWLKAKNPLEERLNRAVEEFTLSCAGYCVATYVLGIGDRHNDNIMLKETGELFHIDFGHFLGNFKSKLGVKRERVPFVLTSHFVHIICNGESKGESNNENFIRFKEYCERAYLILRRKGCLLIRLFMMMLSSGIPQLTSISDVDYLKETLSLHLSEKEATEKFQKKFTEALNNQMATNVNWWIHMKARDNK